MAAKEITFTVRGSDGIITRLESSDALHMDGNVLKANLPERVVTGLPTGAIWVSSTGTVFRGNNG